MTSLDSILKSTDITLPTWVHLVKAMLFPVVMHGCESWTIKKAECQRVDSYELWILWPARRSNQSILKEISPEYPLEGLILKLKTPILGLPDVNNWLTGKDPDAGKDWRQEEKGTTENEMVGWHPLAPTQWTRVWASSRSWWWTGEPGMLQSLGSQRVGRDLATEQQLLLINQYTLMMPHPPKPLQISYSSSGFPWPSIYSLFSFIQPSWLVTSSRAETKSFTL